MSKKVLKLLHIPYDYVNMCIAYISFLVNNDVGKVLLDVFKIVF